MTRRRKTIEFAKGLPLPAGAVTETFGFIGRRGSGKSYAAGKLTEGMLDLGAQVVVLDPIGIWYGLRAGAHPYDIPVLGGEHGDIPLAPEAGALIADVVVDKGTSAVLDLSEFSKAKRKRFVADFAERLFHRKKTARSPIHVVLEEAQVFAPQHNSRGSERMLGAIEDIVRLGRNYGIGASLITQRPQSVSKEVLNQVEALVVLQTNGKHERKAIEQWVVHQGIDTHKMVEELPSLPVGHAFLWSPQWLEKLEKIRVLKKRSADTSATPKVGSKTRTTKPKTLSSAELKKLQKAMAETQEDGTSEPKKTAKPSADDKSLLKRIDELTQRLAEAEAKTVEVSVLSDKDREIVEALIETSVGHADRFESWAQTCRDIAGKLAKSLMREPAQAPPRAQKRRPAPSSATKTKKSGGKRLRAGAMRMLQSLAEFFPASMTKRQVAGAAKMKSTGGTFNTYWGELRREEYIAESSDGRWTISAHGWQLLGQEPPKMPPSLDQRMAYWDKRLRSGAAGILWTLYYQHRDGHGPISKDDLAAEVGMAVTGGTYNTYLGILRANDLAQRDANDNYELSDWIRGGN